MKPILSCSDVDFTYQNSPAPALRDVALTVQPGECVLLCGRSGCGKTTFSRLLNGLAPVFYPGALAGQCTAAGLAAGEAAIEDYVPQVGSVFQNPKTQYFNVDTTAELAFPCENSGLPPETIRARVAETARKFHIEPLMGRSVFKLSGGEKQQVAFAAACMLNPKLLVLDEPTSNLDAAAITRMHDMVATMKQCGVTVVLAEHRLAWITDLVDRYFYFADGVLTAQWTAAEFAALPPERLTEYGLRGRTLDDSFIILDEAQNTSREQMKMFLTRMGFGSKVVITGDVTQIDLPADKVSGLKEAMKVLRDVEGVAICRLTKEDVVRHVMVQRIIEAYAKFEEKKK